jgi:hypothetical protein
MAIRIAEEHANDSIRCPSILDHVWPDCECDDTRKDPDVLDHGNKGSFFQVVAQACEENECNDVEDVRGNL